MYSNKAADMIMQGRRGHRHAIGIVSELYRRLIGRIDINEWGFTSMVHLDLPTTRDTFDGIGNDSINTLISVPNHKLSFNVIDLTHKETDIVRFRPEIQRLYVPGQLGERGASDSQQGRSRHHRSKKTSEAKKSQSEDGAKVPNKQPEPAKSAPNEASGSKVEPATQSGPSGTVRKSKSKEGEFDPFRFSQNVYFF